MKHGQAATKLQGSLAGFAEENGLFRPGHRVLAAVSGGPDSVAMLDLLCRLRKGLGIEIGAAHLNHCLRGAESDGDQRFVRSLARRMGVKCHTGRAAVSKLAKRGKLSIETAAREARRDFLERTARSFKYDRIATGHTMDDQAETVLMRLIRGCGPDGLAGIPVKNGRYVRPLLGTGRREVMAYLAARRLAYRTDSTNRQATAFRNKVRLELMPLLRRLNPRITGSLARTAEAFAGDREIVAQAVSEVAGRCVLPGKSEFAIELQPFKGYNKGLRRNIIRWCCAGLLGAGFAPDFASVDGVLALAETGRVGKRRRLPNGLWAWLGYQRLHIGKAPEDGIETGEKAVPLRVPGAARFGNWSIKSSLASGSKAEMAGAPSETVFFDHGRLDGRRLWVGGVRPGLRIRLFGSSVTRKVQDILVDAKVPRAERGSRPVVFAGDTPIWLAGIRRSDLAPVTTRTKKVLRLELTADGG